MVKPIQAPKPAAPVQPRVPDTWVDPQKVYPGVIPVPFFDNHSAPFAMLAGETQGLTRKKCILATAYGQHSQDVKEKQICFAVQFFLKSKKPVRSRKVSNGWYVVTLRSSKAVAKLLQTPVVLGERRHSMVFFREARREPALLRIMSVKDITPSFRPSLEAALVESLKRQQPSITAEIDRVVERKVAANSVLDKGGFYIYLKCGRQEDSNALTSLPYVPIILTSGNRGEGRLSRENARVYHAPRCSECRSEDHDREECFYGSDPFKEIVGWNPIPYYMNERENKLPVFGSVKDGERPPRLEKPPVVQASTSKARK